MNAAQKHRGPDDAGIWTTDFENGHVVLGNTRLAIIDTSRAGHQPMLDAQSGNCITYNGETYNYRDLSEKICLNLTSRSDTEVVLQAYAKLGTDVFTKVRGMFALAIWDHGKHELILARDRFGIKPLYYHLSDRRLIFASELRALLATGVVPRKLSRAGLDSYLASGSVAAPLTIVEGVQQLLPGHYLRVTSTDNDNLNCTIEKFANEQHVARPANRNDAVAQLRAALEESVRLHLVSDVPLGVFLSGGMDSSALVALMSEIGEQRPKTFSVVFDEAELSEEQHARAVAQRFQTEHCEIRLSEQQLIDMLPDALAALDQPTMDGINTYVVSKGVKNAGVTVALSGLGGDELFAGYPSFRRALNFAALPKMPRRVLRAAAVVGKHVLNGSVQREKFWELAGSGGSAAEIYQISRRLFATAVSPPIKTNGNGNTDVVNAVSRLELEGYMANTLLRDTDAMSMAHSLEVRVPFVDVKLVDYALSLPGEWKLGHPQNGVPKPLLADALADLLPRDFFARRKMGFTLPFQKWMQGRMRGEISAVLEDPSVRDVGLAPQEVRELWRRFLQTPRAVGWSRPWSLFVLARWCASNRVAL
ncbi:MAG TPA: asparagine synthase (glutamine-hydrolyzing) [Pyrinomonadaceae bacterium]|nr:asparagine synthase (glutamine-hydrolyzing) [Pyrinomonadaceae bacterium]